MSGHHRYQQHHVAGGRNPVGVPAAPPPPVLSGSGGRSNARGAIRRSRSRSRSPRNIDRSRSSGNRDRYQNRNDVRDDRERLGQRGGGRTIRNNSPGPFGSSASIHSLPQGVKQQSISLITGDGTLPIIRRILDPELVKIPRRPGEGARPIFERDELKEAMRRRFAADDDEDIRPPAQEQPSQRVIAIIHESDARKSDSFRLNTTKDLEYGGPPSRNPLPSTSTQRRGFRDRPSTHHSPPTRDRDLRGVREGGSRPVSASSARQGERGRELVLRDRGGTRDHVRSERSQLQNSGPRSPVRILRDRISRSHSRTPPPMPPEIRRRIIERDRDLRSKLSRPAGRFPGKFDNATQQQDSRSAESGSTSSFRGRGGGFVRGRGGFRVRGPWEHDMFERDGVDVDLKSK